MTRTIARPHRERADTGDVRYRPDITGYSQPRRGRLRAAEKQVADLVTSICRDNGSAGMELTDARLQHAVRQAARAIRDTRAGTRSPEDARPDLVHLAAVATLWAEAIDAPPGMEGARPRAIPSLPLSPTRNQAVESSPDPRPVVVFMAPRRYSRTRPVPVIPGQILLFPDLAPHGADTQPRKTA